MPRFGRIVGARDRPLRSSGGRGVRSPLAAPRSPLALVALLASSITLADDIVARSFCDAPPHDRLCAVVPKDNTDFDASFIYLNLEKNAQNPFLAYAYGSHRRGAMCAMIRGAQRQVHLRRVSRRQR